MRLLSICGIILSALGIIYFLFRTVTIWLDYRYSIFKPELDQHFLDIKLAVESAGLNLALIGCCLCLLCSLILRAVAQKSSKPNPSGE